MTVVVDASVALKWFVKEENTPAAVALLAAGERAIAPELSIRGILRGFGLKMGGVSKARLVARVPELVAGQAMLERVIEPMLRAREALRIE